MKRNFYKYQGTGNDFILFDDRSGTFDTSNVKLIAHLCDRHFGIGADGLMLLRNKQGYDFEMVYFNADGHPSSMCGNGGRCISRFAHNIGAVTRPEVRFLAVDGPHSALLGNDTIKLKMNDVESVEKGDGFYFLNTGSPHYVKFLKGLEQLDVYSEGKAIRNSDRFREKGTNVNFAEAEKGGIFVRTYERGVEDETLSCGTGVTASALAAALEGVATEDGKCLVRTPGGNLAVHFRRENGRFTDIWLEGPVMFVFKGEVEVEEKNPKN